MAEFLTVLVILALIAALPIVLRRGGRGMFRGKGGGGGSNLAGALLELDRITRPSVEHLEEMQDHAEEDERNDGE